MQRRGPKPETATAALQKAGVSDEQLQATSALLAKSAEEPMPTPFQLGIPASPERKGPEGKGRKHERRQERSRSLKDTPDCAQVSSSPSLVRYQHSAGNWDPNTWY